MSKYTDIFEDFHWHSSYSPSKETSKRRIVRSLPAKYAESRNFSRVGDGSLLIHKLTSALWKFADDKKTIVPVFQDDDDVLTEDKI